MIEIQFYRTESGACPVEEFLDGLNARQAQKTPEREIALAERRKRDHLNRRK